MIKKTYFVPLRQGLLVVVGVAIFIFGYLVYSSVGFHWDLIKQKSGVLEDFTQRAITRINANPAIYAGENSRYIGDKKMGLVTGFGQLLDNLDKNIDQSELEAGKINLLFTRYRGLFSISDFLLVYPVDVAGDIYYAWFSIAPEMIDNELNAHLRSQLQPAVFIAVVLVLLLIIYQLRQLGRVNRMIAELTDWADNLNNKKNLNPLPEAKSGSMSYITYTLNSSLSTFSNILEKEYSFARFTSHELRTHVATLKANMEILELIMKDLTGEEKRVLGRMFVAVEDMRYQTEALLWLSKESETTPEISCVEINEIIAKAIGENEYLLTGKSVKVIRTGEESKTETNASLMQIVANNLIRNAFQNTAKGTVHIAISDRGFTIANTCSRSSHDDERKDGFGIGLILVERIVEKLGLSYRVENLINGRLVEVAGL